MNYPFVKCLNPKFIRNKYTNEPMIVGCGHCEACLSRKSSMSVLKCRLESKEHLYSRFVTLTYDEDCVPRMRLGEVHEVIIDPSGIEEYPSFPYGYYEYTGRLAENYPRILSLCPSFQSHRMVADKVGNEDLPHLSKRDLQLFIKRLRKYISDYAKTNNFPCPKIRYFACGEYGPIHFRPHYHLILWFSDYEVNSFISEAISSCWSFGRVSTEIPRDDVSSYVAKYVNGFSHLPEVFKQPQTRPFTLHSQHLGESFFQATKEKIYELPAKEVVRRSCAIANSTTDVNMWRTLTAYYFPRCKGYSLRNSQQRLYSYTLEKRVREIFGKEDDTLVDLSKKVLSYLQYVWTFFKPSPNGQWSSDPNINDLCRYFVDSCSIDSCFLDNDVYYSKCLRAVYMEIRLSKHFQSFVCDCNESKFIPMARKIERFYDDVELFHLNDTYTSFEQFADDWFEDEEEYKAAWQNNENIPDFITQTKVYKRYKQATKTIFENSQKHKKLNDANRIFENY